ncbi:tetratricopeptide repeat protein [Microbulbifer sp. SSSA007]|uniref:tetratricopeptide repeat protein n=1 Tax=Microbulbifer sp. SSSA007 TaxID=3243379 RepID=UPI00403A0D30
MKVLISILLLLISFSIHAELSDKTTEFIRIMEVGSEKGNPVAKFHLGNVYMYGLESVPIDQKKGFSYLLEAAELGHTQAQYNVAASYKLGEGVPQNSNMALNWYLEAAKQDHHQAQLQAALIYYNDKKYSKAVKLYKQSANNGNINAQLLLGGAYQYGQGVPQNYKSAYIWYSIAAASGDSESSELRDNISKKLDSNALSEAQSKASEIFESISEK